MKTLVKRTPSTRRTFPSFFDELFNNEFINTAAPTVRSTVPSVNVKEDDEAFHLEVAIPGFTKKDIDILIEDDVLTISSETEKSEEEVKENYTRREFSYASFKRSFNLPETVDASNIEATQKDGLLNITLPKKEEAKPQAPKKIAIK